jgi:hypothetical protein
MLFDIMEQHFKRTVGPWTRRVKSFGLGKSACARAGAQEGWPGRLG